MKLIQKLVNYHLIKWIKDILSMKIGLHGDKLSKKGQAVMETIATSTKQISKRLLVMMLSMTVAMTNFDKKFNTEYNKS